MRVRCTDDECDDIMDLVADQLPDLDDVNQPTGEYDMAVKKSAKPAADEGKTEAKAKPAKKGAAKAEGKPEKAKKELPAGFGPREIPEGFTGLASLAEAAGRSPAAARRILRANEVSKPEGQHGWYWKDGSKDLKKVAELLAKKEEAEA